MGQEELNITQSSFLGEHKPIPSLDIVELGSTSPMLIEKLFNTYEIDSFSYLQYDPDLEDYLNLTQNSRTNDQLSWTEWNGSQSQLRDLSDSLYSRDIEVIEGEEYDFLSIMALGSKVKLQDGSIKQILMVDFETSDSASSIEQIMAVNLPRGALLKTDKSFHYYGIELLEQDEWLECISKLTNTDGIDVPYHWLSLSRGFSALRLYGYSGTDKSVDPFVVKKIG